MMEIRQLQVFLAVWENRSFSRAAHEVHLTQPTVSGHIQVLEENLGVRLFDRSGREVTPTKAGELLYPFVRQILRLNLQAEREIAKFLGQEKGSLDLGGSNIPGQYILPGLIGRFKAGRPNIRVMLRISDTAAIAAAVASGELEMGMVGAVVREKGLSFEPCFHDEMVLIVPQGHRLADCGKASIDDLASEPFVLREKGSGTRLATERALQAAGNLQLSDLQIVAEMGSTEAIRQAVRAGLGCSVVSRLAVRDDLEYGLLHAPVLEGVQLSRKFYLIWHNQRSLSPLALAFRNFLLPDCTS
ncbi:MAG: LysR family transcriptional regulator [Deltaproteobacteria bacterium]|nr:LysR family transcriptional regulator [Deltaproteobacteria bacterium]MBW1946497.1 LysR family transcriptional regulator [Deltaproteobacteria bacterium]MBW2097856.1 LysR family transcriptional regulator [Deltaproteobacteria bacterium]